MNTIISQSLYGSTVQANTVDNNISPQLIIYLLQQQLIQCSVINQHLESLIYAFEWKHMLDYGKAAMKSDYVRMQEKYIQNIEKILEKTAISHQKLRNRVEAIEIDAIKLRETFVNQIDNHRKTPQVGSPKARLHRTLKKDNTRKQLIRRRSNEESPRGPDSENSDRRSIFEF